MQMTITTYQVLRDGTRGLYWLFNPLAKKLGVPLVRNLARIRSSGSTSHKPFNGIMISCVLFFSVSIHAIAANDMPMPEVDTATQQPSVSGRYEISFDSVAGPIEINTIHEWKLTVLSSDGAPVDGLTIEVEGGMPMHNHGLPTAPRVTESLGDGQYRVEGFKFQMPGHWTVTFNILNEADESDSVTFNLML